MEDLTTQDFITIALKGFALGYSIGFLHWAVSYCASLFRRSVMSATKIIDIA